MWFQFMDMVKKGFMLIVVSVLLISTVSAGLWFNTQPEEIYSIGDDLAVTISVSGTGNQLRAKLSCENEEKLIFLRYLENVSEEQITQPLTRNFLGDSIGKCRVLAEYGLEKIESSYLAITDNIFIKIEANNRNLEPGEAFYLTGEAEKANTQLLNGFFDLVFSDIDFTTSGPVDNGQISANFTLPEKIPAGSYLLNLTVYEKAGEEISNIGRTLIGLSVKQKPQKIDAALVSQEVVPGTDLEFKILLYDQTEELIEREASFFIENSEGEVLHQTLTNTNKDEKYYIEKNLPIGYYKMKLYSSEIYGERQFYVAENEEAEFIIVNGTLTIRNVGNVPYNKAVQVQIGDSVEIINDEIALGKEKKYQLLAPDGDYKITVTDGKNSQNEESILLTGNAIGIRRLQKTISSRVKILVWAFILLVMGMFIFISTRKVIKKKFVLNDNFITDKIRKDGKGGVIKVGGVESNKSIKVLRDVNEAEHSLVLKGQKQNLPLVCLKVNNEINKETKQVLDRIIKEAQQNSGFNGATYKSGNYILTIFSPLITRTFKNYTPAVKVAIELNKKLKEYNQKFQNKIDFGISVHAGDIVNSIQDNKLKFTGLGNTLSAAKKISDIAKNDVLLSKEIHEKTLVDIKTEKFAHPSLELFKVERVVQSEKNQIFIQDFLKKLAEEGKNNNNANLGKR